MYKLVNKLAAFNICIENRDILNFIPKAGLDLEKMTDMISASAGGSWGIWFLGQLRKSRKQGHPIIRNVPGHIGGKSSSIPLEKRLVMEIAQKF